ncbi:SHOCT domain-containing protein [Cryobacterium sp. CG_9.6]|uniref:SHOCT domain-containing protein n=1 Tax=Cryobacterium sp. CG_9.6 TaxID=2760710 RepID=UPI002476B579|nr:SHOCT domain-containing protein [Cryobacterium sp. CG_9.6]MDH6238082.1 putative membrane protein [Cryobacterium sp. CG_9.6]
MMWGASSMGWTWGFGLLVIVGVALIIYVLVRVFSGRPTKAAPQSGARLILDERFARGELTEEQYREHRRTLADDR